MEILSKTPLEENKFFQNYASYRVREKYISQTTNHIIAPAAATLPSMQRHSTMVCKYFT